MGLGILQPKGNTMAQLEAKNPTLLAKEICVETDTGRIKIGPMPSGGAWNSLPYAFETVVTIPKTGSYTLKASDASSRQRVSGTAVVSIPDNVIAPGQVVEFVQASAGVELVTLKETGNMKLFTPSTFKTRSRWSTIVVYFESATEGVIGGDTA